MLESYLPVIVFLVLGVGLAVAFTNLNRVLGPRRPNPVKQEPYECGLPSEGIRGSRFKVSFYLVGMLFILFDIEVILLFPVATAMRGSIHALGAVTIFILILAVAFVYDWRRGSLDWSD
jgi:NADH-quinone oxidoreductase subunit A